VHREGVGEGENRIDGVSQMVGNVDAGRGCGGVEGRRSVGEAGEGGGRRRVGEQDQCTSPYQSA
jgi:hypothetical protein